MRLTAVWLVANLIACQPPCMLPHTHTHTQVDKALLKQLFVHHLPPGTSAVDVTAALAAAMLDRHHRQPSSAAAAGSGSSKRRVHQQSALLLLLLVAASLGQVQGGSAAQHRGRFSG